ncbi:MAG: sulfite exporter TauE/SafE family protein [Spirochaetes bacterium]|nr:sulfite exporter TauE/SafE family protein [Spirochaetota bacterium]MBU0953831.1 sulfite exporter TauE/SafE family protein [Spirochaetota bacterium]
MADSKNSTTQGSAITRLQVQGMMCGKCEKTVSDIARAMPAVLLASASSKKGLLELHCETGTNIPELVTKLAPLLEKAGYPLKKPEQMQTSRRDLRIASVAGLVLAALFLLAELSGLFTLIPVIGDQSSFFALLLAGLLTSLHCVSMCGGIALSAGLPAGFPTGTAASTPPRQAAVSRLLPSLKYNLGRIVSYTLIGALAGAFGRGLGLSSLFRAILMAAAAVFMLLMSLSMTGLLKLPRLRLPGLARLNKTVHQKAAGLGPLAIGLANGLMPCGPLQAMQLFALGSGSALAGALAMFAFSVGTVPLLFLFGSGGALLPIRYRLMAVRTGAILIGFLGLTTLGRAWSLAGFTQPLAAPQAAASSGVKLSAKPEPKFSGTVATIVNGIQEVRIDVGARSYGEIIVQSGIPVRFNLNAAPGKLNGCNDAIIIPAFKITKPLVHGDNIIEFTPQATGIVPYSCWMGMINSRIIVVAELP